MSAGAIVWSVVGLVLVALLIAAGVRAASAVREAKRVAARLDGYGTLPVVEAFERAERDSERLSDALDKLEPLLARASAAINAIRRR